YKWIGPIARDLQLHKGQSIVVAGDYQPPIVHALAHVMNSTLGNVGKTVFYTDPLEGNPTDQVAALQSLANDLNAGHIEILLILGGNPVFTAPVDLGMRDAIRKAHFTAYHGLYFDETSEVCPSKLPPPHFLQPS